jgi:hypothetical protein
MAAAWDLIMHALAVGAQTVDTSIADVRKQGAGIAPIENIDGPSQWPLEQGIMPSWTSMDCPCALP